MMGLFKNLLLLISLSWSGPIVVRNGAGLSEFYLVYAQAQHQKLIQLCLAQENCAAGFETPLRDLLRVQISAELNLIFLTSQEMGAKRVIAISSTEIQINKDLLVNETPTGPEAWKYDDAVRFFVHLRAASLKWDASAESAAANRLVDFADVVQERSMNFDYQNLSLVLFTDGSSVLLEDSSSTPAARSFEVPLNSLDCQASSQSPGKVSGLKIRSAAWTTSNFHDTQTTVLGFKGVIEYQCPTRSGAQQSFRSHYQVFAQANRDGADWNVKQESLQLLQTDIQGANR